MDKNLLEQFVQKTNQAMYEERKREERKQRIEEQQHRIDHQNALNEVNLDVVIEAKVNLDVVIEAKDNIDKPLISTLFLAFMNYFKSNHAAARQRETQLNTPEETMKRRKMEFDFLYSIGICAMVVMIMALAWNFISQMSYFF